MEEGKKEEENAKAEPKQEANEESPERERLLRLAAEFDNYKKRVAKEIDNSKTVGKSELASKLLSVLDEFQLALESVDLSTEQGKGMAIVLSNMSEVLKKEGLQEIPCEGVYDPYVHEVMMAKESNEKEGTILGVLRKGYTWKGIMLRPASIIVSKGGAAGKEEETAKK